VWCGQRDKFARRNDLGLLPKCGKVAHIAGDEIVRAGLVGSFEEAIVIRIGTDFEASRWIDQVTAIAYQLQKLQPDALGDMKLWSRKHVAIFG
jgi:hypothetical protein